MNKYQDYYFHKAKKENYPARSVYKLKEIDDKYHFLRKGSKVVDLGAAPGSWTLYAAERISATGFVISCDLKELKIDLPDNVLFFKEDIFNPSEQFQLKIRKCGFFDLVMSDMAPATTGNKFTDQARSFNLAYAAFTMAQTLLRFGGSFIVKIFMGTDMNELLSSMKQDFQIVKIFKPDSSRSESKEIFIIGINFIKNRVV